MIIGVTGASGHLGGNLIRALLTQGHQVKVLVQRDTRALEGLDLERIEGGLSEDALARLCTDCDQVYHLAAHIGLSSKDREISEQVNVAGTRLVVDACQKAGVGRLIHCSSIRALSAYPLKEQVDETRALALKSNYVYDYSKAQAEEIVVASDLDVVIVNPTAVIGPYDFKPSRMGLVFRDLRTGKLPIVTTGGFDWVDVRDVVAGMLAVAERGTMGERYLLCGHYSTLMELCTEMAGYLEVSPPRMALPTGLVRLGVPFVQSMGRVHGKEPLFSHASLDALIQHQDISSEKARKELGYTPRPLAETLVAIAQEMREGITV